MQYIHSQMIQRVSLVVAALASLAWVMVACSKSKPPEEPAPVTPVASNQTAAAPTPKTNPVTFPSPIITNTPLPNATTTVTNVAGTVASAVPSASAATPEQIQRLASLEKSYVAAGSFDDRFDVALAIGKAGGSEAVKTLERLFRAEKDSGLRTELINALIGISECKEERLSLLRLGIAADQAAETREAAIDGLIDLEDARALPLLKEMSTDPNEQVRTVAKHALGLLTELLKTP